MITDLIKEVWLANLYLQKSRLVVETFGNVSGINRAEGLIAIKPSGVKYDDLTMDDIVVIDLEGNIVYGSRRPSSDTATHIELYKAFPSIGGITHTHSTYATVFAQACREIKCYGTTHADYFNGSVPLTRFLSKEEVELDYERNTGMVIIERFRELDPALNPGVLVVGHGPFTWGKNAHDSLSHSIILEQIALTAFQTELLNPKAEELPQHLLQKHFNRKHGPNAYYGQKLNKEN